MSERSRVAEFEDADRRNTSTVRERLSGPDSAPPALVILNTVLLKFAILFSVDGNSASSNALEELARGLQTEDRLSVISAREIKTADTLAFPETTHALPTRLRPRRLVYGWNLPQWCS